MADTSPHAIMETSPGNTLTEQTNRCKNCGTSLVGHSAVNALCSPCFWASSQNQDPSLWKGGILVAKPCCYFNCPFDAVTGKHFCPAHEEKTKQIINPDYEKAPPNLPLMLGKAIKFDDDKLPLDLLPFEALEEVALVLKHGKKKYGAHNWRNGFNYSRPFSAILRHLFAYWKGEDLDKDSGLHHLAHAGCELLFLLSFIKTKTGVDDRYKKEAENESAKGS